MVNTFLARLPLKSEEEEAQKTHKLLCEQVAKGNANVMGSNKQQVMEALQRIRAGYSPEAEVKILDEEGLKIISKLI